MKETEVYGECDEIKMDGGCEECKTCTGCDIPEYDKRQHMLMPAVANAENTRTQPVRIQVTDLVRLHAHQQTDDETPGGVIHRILDEHDATRYDGGEFNSDEDTIMKYEGVITTQTEKIRTLQREVQEQKGTIEVLKSNHCSPPYDK